MNQTPNPTGFDSQEAVIQGSVDDSALQTAAEFFRVQKALGLSFAIRDKHLNSIVGQITDLSELVRKPEFVAYLSQDLFVSDIAESTWFRIRLRQGHFKSITLVLAIFIHVIKLITESANEWDFLKVVYSDSKSADERQIAVVPRADFTPDRIYRHFSAAIGATANDPRDIGKLLCHLLHKQIHDPSRDAIVFTSRRQGFFKTIGRQFVFSPPRDFYDGLKPYYPKSLLMRQFPSRIIERTDFDMTPVLRPAFEGQKELFILVLLRVAALHLFLFARLGIHADQVIVCRPTLIITVAMLVALLKDTNYSDLHAPPIGPKIKPLRFDLEAINDGTVVVIDPFKTDERKKAERGYDLVTSDALGAQESGAGVRHIIALISSCADLYIDEDRRIVLDFGGVHTDIRPGYFQETLRRLDADLIDKIERGCRGNYIDLFKQFVDEVKENIPRRLPRPRVFLFIILMTSLRLYNNLYTPLFGPDMEQFIEDVLCTQERDQKSVADRICMEFGSILNRRISDGFYSFAPKNDVTQYQKGKRMLVVDRERQRIYMETAETAAIAHEMASISDPDSLTGALYDSGYLPQNAKGEKSVRIAAITSEGVPYPLYVQALNFTLLSPENRQQLELLDKAPFLFRSDEFPADGFLPILKTVDGRFAGKKLTFEAESSHHYLGTGRSGSGKSWALGQLMPMLRMLSCNVVVIDTSSSFTEAQLRRMLPGDVVDRMFRFIHIGAEKDRIPVNLGSLAGCISLPDRKRLVYSLFSAAVGKFDRDRSKDNQQRAALKGFLSGYLKDKYDRVDLEELTEELRSSSILSPRIIEVLCSVFQELAEIGYETQGWSDLFSSDDRILVLDLGREVGDISHVLLDILVASLNEWQYQHNEQQLAIFIDELADQNFAEQSPLNMILKQGRKQHIMLLGATQDYFSQGNSSLDVMKQATIKCFARPGKSEDRIAEQLGFSNAIAAGFHQFKPGDVFAVFDSYNKETGENEPVMLRGHVVDFVETPLYDRFLREYSSQENQDDTASLTIIPQEHNFVNQNGGKNHETTNSNG